MGTQKIRIIETVLLSTGNKCLSQRIRKYSQFYATNHVLAYYIHHGLVSQREKKTKKPGIRRQIFGETVKQKNTIKFQTTLIVLKHDDKNFPHS